MDSNLPQPSRPAPAIAWSWSAGWLRGALLTYTLLLSFAHLFGYWRTFGINALEYLSLTDLPKQAAFPLFVSLLVFFVIGGFAAAIPKGERHAAATDQKLTRWYACLGLAGIAWGIISKVVTGDENWGVSFGLGCGIALTGMPVVRDILFPIDWPSRAATLAFLCAAPFIAFYIGAGTAESAQAGRAGLELDIERSALALMHNESRPVMYLGTLGRTQFLYETLSGTLMIMLEKDDRPLYLIQRRANADLTGRRSDYTR